MMSTIMEWENEKKAKAKRPLERKQVCQWIMSKYINI